MNIKLKNYEKFAFISIFTIAGIGVYLSHADLRFFEDKYVREDSFIEWLTVISLLLGSFINFYRAKILASFRRRRFVLSLVVMAFIFLFGVGEEISWGQRIIGFKSPAFFMKYNTQMEFNLHNLKFGETKLNKLVFGLLLGIMVGIYFVILPVAYQKMKNVKKFIDSIAIPIPRYFHVALLLALVGLVKLIDSGKKGEILEFGSCWIFVMMVMEPLNRDMFSRKSFER